MDAGPIVIASSNNILYQMVRIRATRVLHLICTIIASLQAAINCGERANNDFTVCIKRETQTFSASTGPCVSRRKSGQRVRSSRCFEILGTPYLFRFFPGFSTGLVIPPPCFCFRRKHRGNRFLSVNEVNQCYRWPSPAKYEIRITRHALRFKHDETRVPSIEHQVPDYRIPYFSQFNKMLICKKCYIFVNFC